MDRSKVEKRKKGIAPITKIFTQHIQTTNTDFVNDCNKLLWRNKDTIIEQTFIWKQDG